MKQAVVTGAADPEGIGWATAVGLAEDGYDVIVTGVSAAELERTLGPAHAHGPSGDHVQVDPKGVTWMRSPCLGKCDQAPAARFKHV